MRCFCWEVNILPNHRRKYSLYSVRLKTNLISSYQILLFHFEFFKLSKFCFPYTEKFKKFPENTIVSNDFKLSLQLQMCLVLVSLNDLWPSLHVILIFTELKIFYIILNYVHIKHKYRTWNQFICRLIVIVVYTTRLLFLKKKTDLFSLQTKDEIYNFQKSFYLFIYKHTTLVIHN